MSAERTIGSVAPDLSRREDVGEIKQEGNLLIEAVSLLVQRQRETETWISEQLWQAEQRAADTERRYADLESRLEGIETHLAQLVGELEPGADDGRIARLREQVQDLRRGEQPLRASEEVTRPIPSVIEPAPADRAESTPLPPAPVVSSRAESAAPVPPPVAARPAAARPVTASASASGSSATFWELLGSTPEDRFGVVLIGLGAIAVLYALLSQLRFG